MKKLIKYIIYIISSIYDSNRKSKVIYYHDISTKYTEMGTDLDLFKKHVYVIKKEGYEIVPKITNEKNQIMICFDDGWKGIYDEKDYFLKENLKPTVFVAISLIGKDGYLSLMEILELKELGFVFESHAWSHYNLSTFNSDELKKELNDSKIELSNLLKKKICSICFPQGYFTKRVIKDCYDYGYTYLYSSIPGGYFDFINEHNIICRNLVQFHSPYMFKLTINTTPKYIQKRAIRLHCK